LLIVAFSFTQKSELSALIVLQKICEMTLMPSLVHKNTAKEGQFQAFLSRHASIIGFIVW
jgi:hypothetical protein